MEEVPRHLFIPEPARNEAYEDRPVPIGEEQTISQPYIVAAMISYLQVTAESRVLEVGTGTGYQAAVLSRLVSEVFTIERHPSLAGKAREILKELNYANIQVNVGDGSLGLPAQGPYDRIIVAAAAPSVPAQLLEQLREGGRLVIPVGSADVQVLQLVRRQHGEVLTTNLEGCRFVPLLGQGGFQPRNF
jgi:protein-L-isoaspartate(D-aspartate) O-methyltransferase